MSEGVSSTTTTLHSRAGTVFDVSLILAVVATVFVGLRLASKWGVVKRNNSDDVFTIIAWVFMVGLNVAIMIGAKNGLGAPDSEIRSEHIAVLKKSFYSFTILYNPALMATKTAILLLYIRMAAAHPFLRYASYGTLTIVNLAGIVLTFLNIFQCRPIRAAFDGNTSGTCIDIVSLYLSSAPINVLTDLAILLLPLPILTQLRMEFRQKVALVATFTVGAFVTIVDVIRIAYLQDSLREEVLASNRRDENGIASINTQPMNFVYHASFSLMWSSVEVSVGLMCCCVLVLKPLVIKVIPKLLMSRARRHSSASNPMSANGENVKTTDPRRRASKGGTINSQEGETRPRRLSFIERMTQTRSNTSQTFSISDLGSSKDNRSPNPNLGTILEGPPVPYPTGEDVEGGEGGGEDSDGDMDFFQMLAADPPTTVAPTASTAGKVISPPHPAIALPPISPIMANASTLPDLDHIHDPNTPSPSAPAPPPPRKGSRRATILSFSGRSGKEQPPAITQAPTQNFFDFVNMNGRKPLTELTAKEAWWPILFVSILFFLWGFAYGLLGTLNGEIIQLLSISSARSIALHNAYWLGYLVGPLGIGHWVLTRAGFKAAFMTGLAIYACGAMSYWPSSVLRSYAGFFISNFMVACGLSVLEVAANPFIALAGPGRLSESRLCFSQGIQAIGGFSSPILAQKALFQRVKGIDLFRVQWCYLAVALFVTFLAVVFFYVPLAEASDSDLEAIALQRLDHADLDQKDRVFGRVRASHFLLATGVLAMFLYVGAQETVSYYWSDNIETIKPGSDAFWASAISHGLFMVGRFLVAFLTYLGVTPRLCLAVAVTGAFVTSMLSLFLPPGDAPLAMLLLAVFFESAIFPLVFAITLRNQGRYTKFASSALTMAISGGAAWPSVAYGVVTLHPSPQGNSRKSIRVTVALYAVSLLVPAAWTPRTMRRWIDPEWSDLPARRGSVNSTGWSPHMSEKGEVTHTVDVSDKEERERDRDRTGLESPAMKHPAELVHR